MDSMEQCRPRAEANTIVITAWNGGYLPQFLAAWVNGSVSNASNINQVGLQCFSVMQQLTERKTARPNQTIQWLEISQGLTGRWQKGFLFFLMCFFFNFVFFHILLIQMKREEELEQSIAKLNELSAMIDVNFVCCTFLFFVVGRAELTE